MRSDMPNYAPGQEEEDSPSKESEVIGMSIQTTGTEMKTVENKGGGPTESTPNTSEKKTIVQTILGRLKPKIYPITTFSVLASLAKHSRLAEKGSDLRIHVERFSSRLPALSKVKDPRYYSWKTCLGSSTMTTDTPSQLSWKSWGVSAIDSSGKLSALTGSVYPRHVPECSLLDILQAPEDVPDRYYLSPKMISQIQKQIDQGMATLVEQLQQETLMGGTPDQPTLLSLNTQEPSLPEDIVEDSTRR